MSTNNIRTINIIMKIYFTKIAIIIVNVTNISAITASMIPFNIAAIFIANITIASIAITNDINLVASMIMTNIIMISMTIARSINIILSVIAIKFIIIIVNTLHINQNRASLPCGARIVAHPPGATSLGVAPSAKHPAASLGIGRHRRSS